MGRWHGRAVPASHRDRGRGRDRCPAEREQAHTCFFSIDLPEYTSLEVMQERLLYAITECRVIDTDYLPREYSDREYDSNASSGEASDADADW